MKIQMLIKMISLKDNIASTNWKKKKNLRKTY